MKQLDNCPKMPTTESQCRPLTKLAPDKQRIAWQQAVETAPAGKVTAAVENVRQGAQTPGTERDHGTHSSCVIAIAGQDRPPGATVTRIEDHLLAL